MAYERYLDLKKIFEEPDESIRNFIELIERDLPLLAVIICPEKNVGNNEFLDSLF
jgi:hypothetical protein